MLSSGQISQMMQQQNQLFSGVAATSHQISAQMPGVYSQQGLGTPMQGGGGFSYGSGGGNFSAQFANTATATMGGAAHMAYSGLGLTAMLGGFGTGFARNALDPFGAGGSAFMKAAGAAKAGGAGIFAQGARGLAAGALGALPALGLGAAVSHGIGSMVAGAQEQSGVEQALSQFQFINSGASGGRGFSRGQSKAIGDMMRQMQELPEMMTSMGELTRIMDRMGQMGMMSGLTDAGEFQRKFKEGIKVLKNISKVMGTTMEEALPMFGEIRRSGFYSTQDVLKNAMQRQVVGGLTGMSQGQVGQVAQYGAQVSFATGGSRRSGAQHSLRMAGQLGAAHEMGLLTNDQLLEFTGQEGGAGVQALAGQLTQASYRMSRGSLGTAMTLALGEQEDGRYTGAMDPTLVSRFQNGEFSKSDLIRMAKQKSASRDAKMSFTARRGAMRSEMASSMGVSGQMQMLQNAMGGRGFDDPDALRIVSQRFGLSEREADMMVSMGNQWDNMRMEMKQKGSAEAKRLSNESFMRERYSWDAVKTKTWKRITNVTTEPLKELGAGIRDTIYGMAEDFVDDMTGRYTAEVKAGMGTLVRQAVAGSSSAQKYMSSLAGRSDVQGLMGKAGKARYDLGRVAAASDWLSGETSAGEIAFDTMRRAGFSGNVVYDGDEFRSATSKKGGYVTMAVNYEAFTPDEYSIVHKSQIAQASKRMIELGSGGTTARLAKLHKGMQENPALARSLQARVDVISLNQLASTEKEWDSMMRSKKISLGGASGVSDMRRLAKVSGVSEPSMAEMAIAGGADSKELLASLREGGRSLAGFGKGTDLRAVARAGDEARADLRDTLGDDYDEVMGIMDKGFGDPVMQLFFGTGEKGTAGFLGGMGRDYRQINPNLGPRDMDAPDEDSSMEYQKAYHTRRRLKGAYELEVGKIGFTTSQNDMAKRLAARFERQAALEAGKGPKGVRSAEMAELIAGHKGMWGAISDRHTVASIAKKMKSGVKAEDLSGEEKELLNRYKIQGDQITPENVENISKLIKAVSNGNMSQDAVNKLLASFGGGAAEALLVVGDRAKEEGIDIATKVAQLTGMADDMGLSAQGRSALTEAGELATSLREAGDVDVGLLGTALGNVGKEYADVAESLYGLKGRERRAVEEVVGSAGSLAASQYGRVMGKTRKGGRKRTLAQLGYHAEDFKEDPELYRMMKGIISKDGGADTVDSAEEARELARFVATNVGGGRLGAVGATSTSAYANPVDIAKHMSEFSESTRQLAAIVSAIDERTKE